MNKQRQTYFEAMKSRPGLLFHLALFVVMCILAYGVWISLEKVFPEGADLGQIAIVARLACILVLIAMLVKATPKIVRRAALLIVIATALEAGEFGCHWMYARELSTSRQHQAEIDRQKVLDSELADKQAHRVEGVAAALAQYNASQAKLSQADTQYYRQTGVRRNRKINEVPGLDQLGVITSPSPTPTPALLSSALRSPLQSEMPSVVLPLTEAQVLVKWTPRFVLAAILALIFVFVGTSALAANWEWDRNGNGINDAEEMGKG